MTPATVAMIVAISSIGFAIMLAIAWWSALRRFRRLSKQLDEQRPFSDFIRNADLAVILTDRERRITWTNDAFTEATGFALDEVRGEKPGKFLQCKETADSTIGELRHALDSGKGFAGELLNCDKSGRRYWVEIYIEPYFDANDQLAGFCSLQRDITDRKALEDALAESHALFNGALDAATVGIAILDAAGNVLFVNSEWRRTFGESDARGSRVTVGSNYFDNCSESIHDSVVNGIRRVESGELPVFEMEYQDPQSRTAKWRSLRITKFGPQGSVRLMVTIEDTSERKAAAERLLYKTEKLKIAQAQAESASRSKSEFLANMSHEIRTPMTAILGYTDILQEMELCSHCQSTQQTKVAVETIQRNSEHLLAIINDILDISKIEADKMTTELLQVSLPALVTDLLDTMQVKAQAKGLALEYEALSPLPVHITTDPTRLRQILVNLLGNAIKFTEVGSVRVALRVDELDSRRLLVQVDDTGIGMTDEQMGRLFNAFEQADSSTTRRFGGTGLGLRISKRLAEMLGGEIGVARNAVGGSTFTLAINIGESNDGRLLEPAAFVSAVSTGGFARVASNTVSEGPGAQVDVTLAPQTLRAIEPANSAVPVVRPLEGANILVAEDGPDNQRLILHHLRKAGATVQLVQNGKHTVETLTQNGDVESALKADHGFHLILMDMQMPTMDGYKATRILRSKGLTIPIIALTAHAMDGDLQRCLEAGCDLRLTKPIDRPKLIETCRSIYVGGATAGANVLQLEAQLCPTVAFQNPVAV